VSGLLAGSSLNSRLGMQDGPVQEPWPWLRSPAGVSSSFLCYSTSAQMGVPGAGRGEEGRLWGPIQTPQKDTMFSFLSWEL
jgi:hypothetical protein